MSKIVGHISQVIGPVVDVHFKLEGKDAEHALPKIHDAMTIVRHDGRTLVKILFVPWQWTARMDCSAEWKSCQPVRQLQCRSVLRLKDE